MKGNIARRIRALASLLLGSLLFAGCGSSTKMEEEEAAPPVERGPEWVESTHGKTLPDTTRAFPVLGRTMLLSVDQATWNSMVSSLAQACGATAPFNCNGSSLDAFDSVSAWRKADLLVDGQKWSTIGIRMVPNGELADAWKDGTYRFPLRINTDKWEKEVPTIDNQRFYGFQKLSLNNLSGDSTGLRHQVSAAAYRSQGVAAYRSGLVALKFAHGTDTLDLGMYSLREAIDGPFLSRWFSTDSGNLYQPTSALAVFASSDFSEGSHDQTLADVRGFVETLNSPSRMASPAEWRAALAQAFDVDGFLNWLAVSRILGDHGSYGSDSGNYALYAHGGRLRWMALDLDQTLPTGSGLTRGVWSPATGWPLVSHLLADSVLCESYKSKLRTMTATSGGLSTTKLVELVTNIAATAPTNATDAAARREKLLLFARGRQNVLDTSLAAHTCPYRN